MCGVVTVCCGTLLAAQEPQSLPTPTLHVYAERLQVPVLVLDRNWEPLTEAVAASRFSLSLDAGPRFRASHVRQEGDDPISMSILLDVSGETAEVLPQMDAAIAGLAPEFLHAKDHVTVYVLDCTVVRSPENIAADAAGLKQAVDTALSGWTERKKQGGRCSQKEHLWDTLAFLTEQLHKLPGRRVILAVTEGKDKGSLHTWKENILLAQSSSVAVFGVKYFYAVLQGRPTPESGLRSFTGGVSSEDPMNSVTQLSGGLLLTTGQKDMQPVLERIVEMVRSRYILEFPRPTNESAGRHGLEVHIESSDDFIRASGVQYPLVDPSRAKDPTTVVSDTAEAPQIGKRKALAAQH